MEDPMINGLRQTSDIQDMETQASPSLLSIRQSDLKIIIDDFPEDQMKPSVLAKKQSNIQFITKMIEKIKSLSRKKKVSGNINEYNTCHSCRGLLERNLLICCSVPDCQRYFCFRCLNKKFNVAPEMIYEILTSSSWDCVSCKGSCNCKICKDRFFGKSREFPAELTRFEKSKKKQSDFSIKVENDHASDINAVKREFIEDQSSLPPQSLASPGLSLIRQDKKISLKEESPQDDTVLFQIYPTFKPRSKAIAKKLLHEKRLLKGTNGNSDSESENEVEENVFKSPRNIYNKAQQKGLKAAVKVGGGLVNKAQMKEEDCHMCGHQINPENIAICSVEGCKKGYCIYCIHQLYQKDFDLESYNPEYWVCYSCGGACECTKCKKRRNTARKNQDSIRMQEELLAMQSNKKGAITKLNEKRRIKYYDMSSDEDDNDIEEDNNKAPVTIEVFKVPKLETRGRKRKQIKTESQEESDQVKIEKRGRKKLIKKEEEEIEEEHEEEDNVVEEEEAEEMKEDELLVKEKEIIREKSPVIDKEDIDDSRIISEVSIDYACITLYDAENEEELKNQVQMKFEMEI